MDPGSARSVLNLEKAKLKARKLEDKGQHQKAVETYLEILDALEGRPELTEELSLFNRVGDLYVKLSKVPEAVEMYERAANLYAESGFPNNAIALCNKVLRNAPGRTHIYLKLAFLMVERGFVAEAKQNLLEYADRMQKAGKTDEAFRALKEFADLSPDNEEIRLLLAEQLKAAARTAEAREQLNKLFHEVEATGDKRRSRNTLNQIRAIDPDFDPSASPKPKTKERRDKSSDLVFLDLDEEYRTDAADEDEAEEPVEAAPEPPGVEAGPLEIQSTTMVEDAESTDGAEVETLAGLDVQREFGADEAMGEVEQLAVDSTSLLDDDDAPPSLVETDDADDVAEPVVTTDSGMDLIDGRDATFDFEVQKEEPDGAAIEVPDLDLGAFEVEVQLPDDPPLVAAPAATTPEAAVPAGPPTLSTLEAAVADDPDDAARHVALGEALLETGDRERGIEELDIALSLHEGRSDWNGAAGLADEIVRIEPNSVRHHQKRVELTYRLGDKPHLVDAYLGLGNALVRTGVLERARLVYQRALEHDPDNALAREAIANLEPEPAAAAPAAPAAPSAPAAPPKAAGGDYVDLGALVMEEEPDRDTRMRVQDEEPTGDEERDFQEMLAQFKRGIEANIDEEDWQAHYDLGVAFKEMGLLDEAIAEFQKALRSPAGRLRTAEALGGCFFDKGQFSVASTVMRRAVDTDPSGDEAKIGLLYWIGRCEEDMKKAAEAVAYYQRVFALDIRFQDVQERVKRLSGSAR